MFVAELDETWREEPYGGKVSPTLLLPRESEGERVEPTGWERAAGSLLIGS